MCKDQKFWKEAGGVGLVWSNSDADGDLMMTKALLPNPPEPASISGHCKVLRKAYELDAARSKL